MTIAERVVLDTSAYSKMRTGHEQVLNWISTAQSVLLPAIVVGELEAGFEMGSRAAENRVALAEFLDEPYVFVLDVTASVARRYAQLFARLRRAGTPIPINDVWIAACTVDSGGVLLSFDADFGHIQGLSQVVLD